MKNLIMLAMIFMGLNSCNKTSENPEDYINFMINNEFQLKYIKNDLKGIEWERGGVQKGVGNFKLAEESKVKFYIKDGKENKYALYYTSMSGLLNQFIGEIDTLELTRKWYLNKQNIGVIDFSGMKYKIDLDNETIERKSDTLTEVFVKVKS